MASHLPRLLVPFAERPERSAVIVDFDGTIAPIVDDPAQARPLPAAQEALGRLVGRLERVAVVSGRPVAFLREVLPVDGLALVGQYGLQRLEDGVVVTDPRAQAAASAVEAAAREAETRLPALTVERKEGVAVTFHWRTAPELEAEALALGRHLAQTYDLALQPARLALELRPPVGMDKGTAARALVDGSHAALAAGDDHGDVATFRALAQLRDQGRLAHCLRVAVRSAEVPAELLAEADDEVEGPAGLAELLHLLADAVESS